MNVVPLSDDEIDRYGRQMLLPEWGAAGQERVTSTEIRVAGRGPAAAMAVRYLAAAGVGRLVVEQGVDATASSSQSAAAAIESVASSGEPLVLHITPPSGPVATVSGELDRASIGAACAVEALKAILGLAHRARVSLGLES